MHFVAIFQLVAFALITDIYHQNRYADFKNARLSELPICFTLDIYSRTAGGAGYFMNAISWIAGMLIAAGVVITGISADKGEAILAVNGFRYSANSCAKVIIGLQVTEHIALFPGESCYVIGILKLAPYVFLSLHMYYLSIPPHLLFMTKQHDSCSHTRLVMPYWTYRQLAILIDWRYRFLQVI